MRHEYSCVFGSNGMSSKKDPKSHEKKTSMFLVFREGFLDSE